MTTYKMTGNTYQNRAEIKAMGGKWDAAKKAWRVKGSLHGDTVRKLRSQGVTVTVTEARKASGPPAGSYAATARMMAGPSPSAEEGEYWDRWKDEMKERAPVDEPESFPMQPHESAPNVCGYCGIQTCPDGCCCGC